MRNSLVTFFTAVAVLVLLMSSITPPLKIRAASRIRVDILFRVVDADTGSSVTGCRPIILKKRVKVDGRWEWKRIGIFGNGDVKTAHSRSLLVRPSRAEWCQGYEFDRWDVQGSGIREVRDLGNHRTKIKTQNTASLMITLYVRKLFVLTVSVNPAGAGSVKPYSRGTHEIPRGTRVTLKPRPHAGWKFDHWTVDGTKVSSEKLSLVMNRDHKVAAHFARVSSLPSTGSSSGQEQPSKVSRQVTGGEAPGCSGSIDISKLKYRGYFRDLAATEDLLRNFGGKASPDQDEGVIIIGSLSMSPQPWERYNVSLSENAIRVAGMEMSAVRGWKDYGIIYRECSGKVIRVTGTTELGTRAALLWLLDHPGGMNGKAVVVVEWMDVNGDHRVQESEVEAVYSVP